MKILISAYACEPNRGSEPGVGWECATRLSDHHEVSVITRSNNSEVIDKHIKYVTTKFNLQFIYVDLPPLFISLKRMGLLPVSLYYLLWQLRARINMHSTLHEYDLVHHVTFNGFRFPGAWWFTPIPVVLGPLGGGSIASREFKRCFGNRWALEWLRGISVKLWKFNPWSVISLISADVVLAVGNNMAERLSGLVSCADTMLETAVPKDLENISPSNPKALRKDFIVVGNIEPWKAWQITFEAYALAVKRGMVNHDLIVVGKGSQQSAAMRLADTLGLADKIKFIGELPRAELWEMIKHSRGLIFSSIRDTSGNAVLEAMALSCPVVCFNHQGVGWMTDDECAIRVEPTNWSNSVEGFAKGMTLLADDESLAERMGQSGRKRAMKYFTWDQKISAFDRTYQNIVSDYRSMYD